ncbi:unnamed protein product [Bursaphelenchus okinawaensis]|uniref:Uncharacterized protein n=1 Tax=Bursaphelenchus okinawaensis TaxID=465554 RepID=A0A811JRB4_9BILA|nr:unnamed protein product [Bursaphelenchus okinawaensis]CAG9078690.1 unnamed protein product [Bursaphelenchus okinawaensis]
MLYMFYTQTTDMLALRDFIFKKDKKHLAVFLISVAYTVTAALGCFALGFTSNYNMNIANYSWMLIDSSCFTLFVSFLLCFIGNIGMIKMLYIPAILCSAILFIVTVATVISSLALFTIFASHITTSAVPNGFEVLSRNATTITAYILFQLLCAICGHLYYKQLMLLINDYHFIGEFVERYQKDGIEQIVNESLDEEESIGQVDNIYKISYGSMV